MKKILYLSSLLILINSVICHAQTCDSLLLESITNPGPFTVSSYDESSGILNGVDYSGATIYYPDNYPSNSLPSIVLVPGFMNTESTIQNWGPFLASHGIITMTIGTNTLVDTHTERRDALVDAVNSLKSENQRLQSPLYTKMDTSLFAVGGFSKGGGGAQLTPLIMPSIKAVVALYPWLDSPTTSDLNHSVPVIIISGQIDAIAPPSTHADVHYALTPSTTDKLKYEVAFASHDPLSGPNGGGGDIGIKVFSWLQNYLLEDSCYCPIIVSSVNSASSYITNVVCASTTSTNNQLSQQSYKKQLHKVTDVLGRESKKIKNATLFYIYNDGTVEKKLIIE